MNRLDWREIKQPSMRYRPMARWWWPGLDVDEKTLASQLDDLKEGGFAGAEIQAFLRGASHLNDDDREQLLNAHGYGTERYFGIVRRLMQKAKADGLLLEVTAGSGYPLGDTEIDPTRDGMKAFVVGAMYVEGGLKRKLRIMSAQTAFNQVIGSERASSYMTGNMVVWSMDWPRMRRDLQLAHVTIARGDKPDGCMQKFSEQSVKLDISTMRDVTGFVIDGELEYTFPDGYWYVFASFEGPSYQRVKTDSRMNPDKESYVVDHFSSGRIGAYLDRHIGRGLLSGYSGTTFRAFFLDSFELVGPYYWSEAFLTEFANRRGYDLTPYLPVIITREQTVDESGKAIACFDIQGGIGERIRRDYDLTLADMFTEYFIKQATAWGNAHNLKSRVQCYGHVMDPLKAFGAVDIPETEQLASAGLLDFLKIPSSAAMLYRKPLATAEAFVWSGCDYMETPLRLIMASDKLTSAGIGQLLYHGMPYIHDSYEWPGYFAWHNSFGSFINRNSLLWPYIRKVNEIIARNQYLTQEGERVSNVCLYMGALRSELPYTGSEFREELSDGEIPGIDRRERYDSIRYDTRCDRWQYICVQTRRAAIELTENGYDYCHINGERLNEACLKNGKLHVGDASFSALIFPSIKFINIETAKRIDDLLRVGFPVFCIDTKPSEAFGFKDAVVNDAKVNEIFKSVTPTKLNEITEALKAQGITPTVDFCGARNFDVTRRLFNGNQEAFFIRSHIFEARELNIKFPVNVKYALLLDAHTGKTARLNGKTHDGWTTLRIPFTHFGSVWIIFGNCDEQSIDNTWFRMLRATVSGNKLTEINDGWKFELSSEIKGDEKRTRRDVYALADWSDDDELSTYTGWGVYENEIFLSEAEMSDVTLDLGIVCDIAIVYINERKAGELITFPYAVNLDGYLHCGTNTIRIEVLNSLRNGMIGANRLQTPHARAASGIIGPIRLMKSPKD